MKTDVVRTKFYEALKKMGITHDPETGRLSKTLIIVVYRDSRKIKTNRVFSFKDHFLLIDDQADDSKRISYKSVQGFMGTDNFLGV